MFKYYGKSMKKKEILDLLSQKEPQELFKQAYRVKLANLGALTYLRALLEYSNFCTRNCFYCGIRAKNKSTKRFEIPLAQMQENIKNVHKQGYASFLIQSGERTDKNFVDNIDALVKYAKSINPNFRIVLSTGEQTKQTYQRWFDSGASSYLLRIETSDKSLYQKIHPPEMKYSNRLKCIQHLQDVGYQTGTGILVGFPMQTLESIAADILFFQKMDIDMLGLGPYIPCHNTPLWKKSQSIAPQNNLELTLKIIAICRILLPDVNIVASTALQTIDSAGYLKGIQAGANVLMPNLTPNSYKKDYALYDNKAVVDDSQILDYATILNETINPRLTGSPKHFLKRKKSTSETLNEGDYR